MDVAIPTLRRPSRTRRPISSMTSAEVEPEPRPTAIPSSTWVAAHCAARRFAASAGSCDVFEVMPIRHITSLAGCSSLVLARRQDALRVGSGRSLARGLALGLASGSFARIGLLGLAGDVLAFKGDLDGGAEFLVVAVLHDRAYVHVFRRVALGAAEVQDA